MPIEGMSFQRDTADTGAVKRAGFLDVEFEWSAVHSRRCFASSCGSVELERRRAVVAVNCRLFAFHRIEFTAQSGKHSIPLKSRTRSTSAVL